MGPYFDWPGVDSKTQHRRLEALRQLIARGIPCILWGEDALAFAHRVPTGLFDQQILVPDELLDAAAAVLGAEEGPYRRTLELHRNYVGYSGRDEGVYPFPRSVRLEHQDIPEDDPYKLEPIPRNIILLPQSYYGLDTLSASRFQSLVPPLDSSNTGILVPKYHTFLEGLVHYVMNSPTKHYDPSRFHEIFIDYLILYRTKRIPSIKHDILAEIQMEDCAWYMNIKLFRKQCVQISEIEEYIRQKELRDRERESNGKNRDVGSKFDLRSQFHQVRKYSTLPHPSRFLEHPYCFALKTSISRAMYSPHAFHSPPQIPSLRPLRSTFSTLSIIKTLVCHIR